MADVDLKDVDLYDLLGIISTASTQEVKKAYRKKALTCHPDKNPDNPRAAELFRQVSRALEVLTDKSKRAAYDKVLNAKKAAKLRHRELDSKRKKLKEELEARERLAAESAKRKRDEEMLQAKIERLRREGAKQVEEEQEYLRQRIIEQRLNAEKLKVEESCNQKRIKMKWKAAKSDPDNGGYNSDVLHKIFSKYGGIVALVISSKKKGTALVEFETEEAATMALELERGLSSNPLKLETLGTNKPHKAMSQSGLASSFDYESVVMHRMRQAQERKRLVEQMMKEDEED